MLIETGAIEVCSNCLFVAVNGDFSAVEEGDPEPWNLIPGPEQMEYVYGTNDHSGTCAANLEWTRDYGENDGCDCADDYFSTRACDACGQHLAGARFTFTRLQAADAPYFLTSDYVKCADCHLFVEPNLSAGPGIAPYVHLHRGDAADELLDESHDAQPSGEAHTLAWWSANGPEAMRARFTD